jgi:formate hydrogenlyase transcriptional activator
MIAERYRLNVFPITVPPLRQRREDISLLVDYFVHKISKRLGKSIENIPTTVMDALRNYHWPGNVRELENVLERAVINSSGPILHLVDELRKPDKDLTAAQKTLDEVERDYIVRVLEQTHWKVSGKNGAAEILASDSTAAHCAPACENWRSLNREPAGSTFCGTMISKTATLRFSKAL